MNFSGKIFSVLLCSAAVMTSFALPAADVYADEGYEGSIREIPVYRKSLSENEKVKCMFFDDLPEIPYMAIDVYYKTFLDGEMTVDEQSDGKYLCTEKNCGETAVIDIKADTFTSDDLALFAATPIRKIEKFPAAVGGPEFITKTASIKIDKAPEPVTIDYKKYNIDIREKDGVVYLPFSSLSDLFGNTDCISAVCRNGNIFFMAYYYDINGGDAVSQYKEMPEWIENGTRSSQMAEFAYNELCLCFDYFYGYPCLHNEFSDRMSEVGLDKALEELAPETKKLLKSEASGEYLAGLAWLTEVHLADGGHSGLMDVGIGNTIPEKTYHDFLEKFNDISDAANYYITKTNKRSELYSRLFEIRQNVIGDEDFHREGDTVLIRFDSFYVEYEEWLDYFSGKRKLMPNDSVCTVYENLERAKADGGVKNIVFDLTTNSGGDTIALDWICATLFGKSVYNENLTAGDRTLTFEIISDKNLDGKIDEKDKAINYDEFNFGVLTSSISFSCGNLFPAMFRDNGAMVLGEQSGGGACCVLQKATADGVIFRMSGYLKAEFRDGSPIDDGIPVDASLVDSVNYYSLYNLKKISKEMNEFYKDKNTPEESSDVSEVSEESSDAPVQNSRPSESSKEVQEEVSETETEISSSADSSFQKSSDGGELKAVILLSVLGTLFGISAIAIIISLLVSRKKH